MNERDAVAAMEGQPLSVSGRMIRVDYAPAKQFDTTTPNHKLYFFDYTGDELDIREALKELETKVVSIYFCAFFLHDFSGRCLMYRLFKK